MVKDKNVYAAIALALHEFKGNNVHDKESGIIPLSKSKQCGMQSSFLSLKNQDDKERINVTMTK